MTTYNSFSTKALHASSFKDAFNSHIFPIYKTSTFQFESTDIAASLFEKTENPLCDERWFVYSRSANPSVAELEERYASLHDAKGAVAFGSGIGAIAAVLYTFLSQSDHIVYSNSTYSATSSIISDKLPKFGIESTSVDITNLVEVEKAIKPNTKILYTESPANPSMKITDLKAFAELGKKYRLLTIVDNTFASAYSCTPLDYGVDIVVESLTKFVNGHGDAMGGIALSNRQDILYALRMDALLNMGAVMAPDTAFLILRGLKTLKYRLEIQSENAMALASFLEKQPQIDKVLYPGLLSHPQYSLSKQQLKTFGGMITIYVKGGREAGKILMNHLKLSAIAVSLGDTETLVEHPASMTHIHLTDEELAAAGISGGMIRISVGLEDKEDIINDFAQALTYVNV